MRLDARFLFLNAGHAVDHDEIAHFIEGVAHHDGGPENIRRVGEILAAAGYTVEGLDEGD